MAKTKGFLNKEAHIPIKKVVHKEEDQTQVL